MLPPPRPRTRRHIPTPPARPVLSLPACVLAAAALFLPRPALAEWAEGGVPVSVAPGDQITPLAAPDGWGGSIIVWEDSRAGHRDIYAQRLTAAGAPAPGWPVDGLPVCTAAGAQLAPALAPDGLGGAFISWTDQRNVIGTGEDIFVQHVLGDGTLAPGWAANGVRATSAAAFQRESAVAPDGAGGAIVAWTDLGTGDLGGQHVAASGMPMWTAQGRILVAADNGQSLPVALPDGSGGAFLAWRDHRNTGTPHTWVLRIDGAGDPAPGWPAGGIAADATQGFQTDAVIAPDGAGGLIVAWEDRRPGVSNDPNIRAQRVTGTGATPWGALSALVCGVMGPQTRPAIAPLSGGGAALAWLDERASSEIFAQRLTPAGVPAWAAGGLTLRPGETSAQRPRAADDGGGGVIVTWARAGGAEIVAQRVNGPGSRIWTMPGITLAAATGLRFDPVVTDDGAGGAVFAWVDQRGGDNDVYAQAVSAPGPTAAALALVRVDADPDAVRLTWQGPLATGTPVTLERAAGGAAWSASGARPVGANGLVDFEDRRVRPGETYAYRAVWLDAGSRRVSSIATVQVPLRPVLGLDGFRPHPARRGSRVAFSVPVAGPVRIELLDVAGRRVAGWEGDVTAGRHEVAPGIDRVPAGVYVLRLAQGGRSVSARAVVVR